MCSTGLRKRICGDRPYTGCVVLKGIDATPLSFKRAFLFGACYYILCPSMDVFTNLDKKLLDERNGGENEIRCELLQHRDTGFWGGTRLFPRFRPTSCQSSRRWAEHMLPWPSNVAFLGDSPPKRLPRVRHGRGCSCIRLLRFLQSAWHKSFDVRQNELLRGDRVVEGYPDT